MEKSLKNTKTYDTIWKEIGISNDFIFGKVMQDPELCQELLHRIFPDLQIDHIEYPELQKSIRPDADAKSVRLDVYVQDGADTMYDIEMQVADTGELPKRTRYYQSLIDLQLIDRGQTYSHLNQSYIIFICPFDPFKKARHIYTFKNFCEEDKDLSLHDETAKIFLNADSSLDDVSRELRAFLDYVAGKDSDDSFVMKLQEAVREAKKNREWRHEFMTLLMRDQENIEKGIQQGREEGIKGTVSILKKLGVPRQTIALKIQEQYNLSPETCEKYL